MWNWKKKKVIQMNLLTEQKETSDLEKELVTVGGWGGLGEGIVRGFGMDMYKLLFLK